jgi:CTP synthase
LIVFNICVEYYILIDNNIHVKREPALQHAAYFIETRVQIDWIEASNLEPQRKLIDPEKYNESWKTLSEVQGILVPGGFGDRGIEGKILAANYARTKQIPFLGLCLGLQERHTHRHTHTHTHTHTLSP